jgi:Ca2+-transporting ATPase
MKNPSRNILTLKGLTEDEVISSRLKFGENVLTIPEREPWWKLYLRKFRDPIIRILILAAVIAIVIGIFDKSYVEGIGIIIAIFLATTISFSYEFKARREFNILNKATDNEYVTVIRNSIYVPIPKKNIVVNDLILIEMGEEIPADGIVFNAVSLQVNESTLTGESNPVTKSSLEQLRDKPINKESVYPVDKVFRGTLVVDGHGVVYVTAVGDKTEIGKTAQASFEETGRKTPLNIQLEKLSKIIGVCGFSIATFTFFSLIGFEVYKKQLVLTYSQWYAVSILSISILIMINRIWGPILYDALELIGLKKNKSEWLIDYKISTYFKVLFFSILFLAAGTAIGSYFKIISPYPWNWLNAPISEKFLRFFMIAVTMIVVAVPEGLAMSVTLSLAFSVHKMTETQNLVRRMHAIETISAATVICTDKTGTLTQNEMQVKKTHFPILKDNLLNSSNLSFTDKIFIESICANTTANLSPVTEKKHRVLGNPTEGALLLWLQEEGINYDTYRRSFEYIHQWTFNTERKFMGTFGFSYFDNKPVLYVKGAPEIILQRCNKILTAEGDQDIEPFKEEILQRLKEYQSKSMRTLAFAFIEDPHYTEGISLEAIANYMNWIGFVAIVDPVRIEVPKAIQECLDAGISVKMVTGDTPAIAKEIAKNIGLWTNKDNEEENLLLGNEFEKLSYEEASKKALKLKILARARPFDKLRLVKLLQSKKQIVAVTGDGTNDAPALNQADVGLAMGKSGTSVAKEASDIILLDDSFQSIVNAVMWGRSLYQNIQKFITFQLTINLIALTMVLLGPFMGIELTLTITQMIWINLIMDTFGALALSTSPPNPSVMDNPPRKPEEFIITKEMAGKIFRTGSFFIVVLLGVIFYLSRSGITVHDLTIFFTIFVLFQFWNLFNAKTVGTNQSAFHEFWSNPNFIIIITVILVCQIFIVQLGGKFFRTEPLSFETWILLILGTSVVLIIGEIRRYLRRKEFWIIS